MPTLPQTGAPHTAHEIILATFSRALPAGCGNRRAEDISGDQGSQIAHLAVPLAPSPENGAPGHPSKKAKGATNAHRAHQTKDLPLGGARRSCGRGTRGLHRRTGTGICNSRPGLRDSSVRSSRARVCGPGPGLRLGSLVVASPLAVAASPGRRTPVDHVHQRPGVLGHLELLAGQDGLYEAPRRLGLGSSSRNHPEPEPWWRYGFHWTKVQ